MKLFKTVIIISCLLLQVSHWTTNAQEFLFPWDDAADKGKNINNSTRIIYQNPAVSYSAVSLNASNTLLVCAGKDENIYLYNAENGLLNDFISVNEYHKFSKPLEITKSSLSPDDRFLAVLKENGLFYIFDRNTKKKIYRNATDADIYYGNTRIRSEVLDYIWSDKNQLLTICQRDGFDNTGWYIDTIMSELNVAIELDSSIISFYEESDRYRKSFDPTIAEKSVTVNSGLHFVKFKSHIISEIVDVSPKHTIIYLFDKDNSTLKAIESKDFQRTSSRENSILPAGLFDLSSDIFAKPVAISPDTIVCINEQNNLILASISPFTAIKKIDKIKSRDIDISISKDKTFIAYNTTSSEVKIYSLTKCSHLGKIKIEGTKVSSIILNTDNGILCVLGTDGIIRVYSTSSLSLLYTIGNHSHKNNVLLPFANGQDVLFQNNGTVYIKDVATQKIEKTWGITQNNIVWMELSNFDVILAIATDKHEIILWDCYNEKILRYYKSNEPITNLFFSAGSKYIRFNDNILDCVTLEIHKTQGRTGLEDSPIGLSADSINVKFWSPHTYSVPFSNSVYSRFSTPDFTGEGVNSILKNPDGSYLLKAEIDHDVTMFPTDNYGNFILISDDHYYYNTDPNNNPIHFERNGELYPIEQFDLIFNRPDIMLRRINSIDSVTINNYEKAYYRRLKNLGFKEDELFEKNNAPEVSFTMTEPKNKTTLINITAHDSISAVKFINVWINDVPWGENDYPQTANIVGDTIFKNYEIELLEGKNKIQVSAINESGAESVKNTKYIFSSEKGGKSNLYIISIGLSNHKNKLYDLTYANKDASDIINHFKRSKAFHKVYTKLLTDKNVTKESISTITDFVKDAKPQDAVVIFFAGHGLVDDSFDYYLASYDIDFESPADNGITLNQLEDIFKTTRAQKRCLFIDACHAGEIDKNDYILTDTLTTKYGSVRSTGLSLREKNGIGNILTGEIARLLYTDIRKGSGTTIIGSSKGSEYALEGGGIENGVFTAILLHGLSSKNADLNDDEIISITELIEFLRIEVSEATKGAQNPSTRIRNAFLNFRIE